jgi:lipopolysaccharide/colanic/teichoic acid biosynthesis glycosyltransferase
MSKARKYAVFVGFDLIFIFLAFILTSFFRGSEPFRFASTYELPIITFSAVWIAGSILGRKYSISRDMSMNQATKAVFRTNVLLLLVVTAVILWARFDYSRSVLIGAMVFTTAFELLATYLYTLDRELGRFSRKKEAFEDQPRLEFDEELERSVQEWRMDTALHDSIIEESGEAAFSFIRKHLGNHPGQALFISTTTRFNILSQPEGFYRNIVNLHRVNDIQFINKFFEAINERLPAGGLLIGCVETQKQRKTRLLGKYPPLLNWIYYPLDYVFKRVFPKLPVTKQIYFLLTRGNNRVLSKAETLGRLYSCGFEVIGEADSNGKLYFAARKVKDPVFDMNPTYGPLVKLRRHGRGGEMIGVYKMRTMYPFAEYLQGYVYEKEGLAEGGKFKDDFRITGLGRFMRKLWLDEFPMFINVFKGEMKIVGVRPLSRHYFNLYTEDLQQRRINYKPGLVPPFYADMPKSLDEVMASERKYLDAYDAAPFKTDMRYFALAMYNIFIKRARSN